MGDEFGSRLSLALAALNMSRGRLAAAVGVDKSVAGRWTRGLMRPSEYNLSQITGLIAAQRPGFDMRMWSGDQASFEAALAAPTPAAPEWLPVSAEHSARETQRDGDFYPGLYVQLRRRFNLPGEPFAELLSIWREGDILRFEHGGAYWRHRGRIFILQHQLYLVGEDVSMGEGLLIEILNSVSGGPMLATDGIIASVQGERLRPPAAAPVVLLRLADLDAAPDAAITSPIEDKLADVVGGGRVAELAGPALLEHLTPRLGRDGDDHLLRMPATRGFTATIRDRGPLAEAAARWQSALA